MTQPEIHGADTPDAESLAFEAAAVLAVTGTLSTGVASLLASLYASWDLIATVADRATFGRIAARRIASLTVPPMAPRLRRTHADGQRLGVRQAVTDVPRARGRRPRRAALPPVQLPDIDRNAREGLRRAERLAATAPFDRRVDLHTVAGALRSTVNRAEGATRWTANHGINSGAAEVARSTGLRLIWVAERNACLDCLAHAGWAVEPGDLFPGTTFDPLRMGRVLPVHWPPLHPNCRCRVRPYDGPAGKPPADRSRLDPAARLAAEARRSTVYQWTDYASGAAMRRAAEALLRAGADLPLTVERRARIALRSGRAVRRPR